MKITTDRLADPAMPFEHEIENEWVIDGSGNLCYIGFDYRGVAFPTGTDRDIIFYTTSVISERIIAFVEIEEVNIIYKVKTRE